MSWQEDAAKLQAEFDFYGAREFLASQTSPEGAIEAGSQEWAEAQFLLARIADDVLLRRVEAARSYLASAAVDSPARIAAVRRARAIQRSLGQLPHVIKSLEAEIPAADDPMLAVDLLVQLGDVFQDAGDHVAAQMAYRNALDLGPDHAAALIRVEDVSALDTELENRIQIAVDLARTQVGSEAAATYLRAARMASRLQDAAQRAYLEAALVLAPRSMEAQGVLDSFFAAEGDLESLEACHRRVLAGVEEGADRALLAREMAARWAGRFNDVEIAKSFLIEATSADPSDLSGHVALGALLGETESRAVHLACLEDLTGRAANPASPVALGGPAEVWLLARLVDGALTAGDIAGSLEFAARLGAFQPQHPALSRARTARASLPPPRESSTVPPPPGSSPPEVEATFTAETSPPPRAESEHDALRANPSPPEPENTIESTSPNTTQVSATQSRATELEETVSDTDETNDEPIEPTEAAAEADEVEAEAAETKTELSAEDVAKLAELDEALAKFEAARRWSDYIKTLEAKAEIVVDPAAKIELYSQAGALYIERSSNQAQAIKCFEKVLALDSQHIEAITRLKEMYEKRRDWEKLVGVMRAEALLMDEIDRPMQYVEMAKLATQRLRKPDICIELWDLVLGEDPENPEALAALGQLHERARNWEPLAAILERQVDGLTEPTELKKQLQKLGMIYADKLNQDEGAVRAFSKLLELDPNDRRAQEQLKRRYVALKDWDQLEAFYASQEKWDELIRVLERAADDKEASTEDKTELLFRVAHLWETQKEKPDRAARAYEKVLAFDENNLRAAEALSPIYETARDAKRLVVVYGVRLEHMEDPDSRIMLLRETGLLYEERLRDPGSAFERFLSAFQIDPSQEVVREDVSRLAEKVDGGWDRVVDVYRDAIEGATDPATATDLRLNYGRVLSQLGKTDEAIAQFQAVYEAEPQQVEAISALGELYQQTGNFQALHEIYGARMELETDPEARRQLAYQTGELWETQLGDPERAIEAYRQIIDEYGDSESDAYRSLDRLYEQQERFEDLAGTLERRIDLGPESTEELAALKFRLGQTLEKNLNDKPRAVDLYREVLTLAPEHDGARGALEALLDDEEISGAAAEILEPVYEGRGDWEPLVRALYVLRARSEDPHRRLELLTKVGEVQGQYLNDPKKSFDAFAEAFAEVPGDSDTLGRLEILALEQERFPELVTLISKLASESDDPSLSRELWIKAAKVDDTQLENVNGAVAAYNKVLEQDPTDGPVLAALEDLYRRTERWPDLVTVLRQQADQAEGPEDRVQILSQMAFIHDNMLENPDAAISLQKEILDVDPASGAALTALDDLYARQGHWADLADNVDRQLSMTNDPDQQVELMLQLAQLRETRMGQVESAIEGYREVLDRNPENGAALASLERLLEQEQHQLLIAEILEPLYRDAGQYQKLIGVHEIQARNASSPDRRVELLHRIAELYELALDDAESAFQSHARALVEDPANETTQEKLGALAAVNGNFEALAQVYEERVANVDDPLLSASLHTKAATIRRDQLGDLDGAIGHFEAVLKVDDQNLDAATALEGLFQMSERYDRLAEIYMVKSKMLSDMDEQKDHLFRAAEIHETILEKPEDAIGVYGQVLEVDPEDLRALDKLTELHLRLSNWSALLEVNAHKADIVNDPDEKKRILLEVGAVYEREIADTEKAIDTYLRILEIDPGDLTAIGRLDALYQATENWQELLSVLEREADLASDPNEVISYRYRIAELWHRRLGDPERAVDIYRDVLGVMPEHPPTRAALEAMIEEGVEPVLAAGVLEPVYRGTGEWPELIRAHEVQITHEEDPVRKVELLHAVAELWEFQLDQPEKAFEAYARALPPENENEKTLESLARLGEQLNGWDRVAALFDVEIERMKADDPDRVVDMALRTAQIYELHLGDNNSAIDRYSVVVEADEAHEQAIEALDRLYQDSERWPELADILQKEIATARGPEEALNLQFRLAQLHQMELGHVEQAIEQYREVLAAAPEHTPSVSALELLFADGVKPLEIGEILEPLYRMQGDWGKLLNVHEVQLHYQADPHERVLMMHRIAEIGEDKAGDHPRAFAWMQRALLEDPAHDHSQSEVERLCSILDGWGQLANTYADVVENDAGPAAETRAFIGKRLARVYSEELGDVEKAEATYRYILGVDDRDEEVLEALDQVYVQYGAHQALSDVLRKRVKAAEHKDDLVQYNFRLGQVLETELGRTEEAIEVYNHVLGEHDPEHTDSIHALQRIYTNRQDWPNLHASFRKELDAAMGDAAQSEILAKMARIAHEQLGDPDRAVELWKQVLDLRGEDREALNALGDIFASQENWADLVDTLEREVGIVDDDQSRVAIYADLGRIWYQKLERDRNSLDSWERVLDIDPTNTGALFAIAEIHRAANQNHELVDTLNRVIDVGAATLDDHQIESVYMQLGHLYDAELSQPVDAIDSYNRVLDVNPRNFDALNQLETIHRNEAMWEDCIQVFERRAQVLEDPAEQVAQLRAIAAMWAEEAERSDEGTSAHQRILELRPMDEEAFGKLEELHTESLRWEELIDMYIGRYEATEETGPRVALLRKMAKVNEDHLGDMDQAFDALSVAWTEDFTDKETSTELERVTAVTNKWNELLALAQSELQEAEDPDTQIQICLHCAKWYGQELNHPEYAIPYYQQIQALDPANVEAKQQLAELYRTTQQWAILGQTLGELVTMTTDPRVKADTYVQMGDLCAEHLEQPGEAPKYYRMALEEDPANVSALFALESIHREAGDWEEMLDVMQKRADALEDPAEVETCLLQIADAYESRLQAPDSAIEAYRKVLAQNEVNLDALRGLERLYEQRERWHDLLGVLEAQHEIVTTERERIDILVRLANMWENQFVKYEKAAERLEEVLDIDPTHGEALTGLARLYRQMQRWEELIQTYERHASATPDRAEKVTVFKAMGEVYAHELGEPERGIDSYLDALNLSEHDVEALDALTRLYDKRGDHAAALEMMEKMAEVASEPAQQIDLRFRMGRLLDEQLGDRLGAIDHYQHAIDVDPGHLPSLSAMRAIHMDSGDWDQAARVLEQESQYQDNPRVIAATLVELGRVYDERLSERERAIEVFEAALKQDADNLDAALPLAREYYDQARFEEAKPLLSMLVKREKGEGPDEQHRLAQMLGEVSSKVGDQEEAIRAFGRAYQLDSSHLPSLLGLARAHYEAQEWDKSFKYYQLLLVHHRDSLGGDETTDTYYRLGVIKREQGERRKALNMFDKALEEDAFHRPTLEAVVSLYENQSEWEQVIHFKKQIFEIAENDDERFDLLDQIGDHWKENVKNTQKAIQAYSDASDIKPEEHKVLHKLLGGYQETRQWEEMIEVIQRISDLDDRDKVKSKYAYTIGVVVRDELKDSERAIEFFNEALNKDSDQLKAFEAINKILTQKKDWRALERAFRKMLHRIVGQEKTELEFNLWHNLGIIYRDRQLKLNEAAEAFRMASNLMPENRTEHQILAEIFTQIPERVSDAIEEHQWMLREDPYSVDSYRALYKLYFDARQYDKAWCLAATLNFFKKADQEQEQFYTQYKHNGMIRPQARVDNERWLKDLFHPEEDLYVGKMFAALSPGVHASKASTDKALHLAKKHEHDPASSTVTFARTFGWVSQVLNINIVPRLFLRTDAPGGLIHVPGSNPPACVCGSTLLSGFAPQDLTFVIGRHLAYYRDEHFIRTLLSSHGELKMVLLAGMRLSGVLPQSNPQVDATAKQLQGHLQAPQIEALRSVAKKFVAAGARTDIKAWIQKAELTGCRAGFLLANDLETSVRMINSLPPEGPNDLAPKEKVKEVVLFSVSEQYFRLREHLGIQIKV